MMKQSMKLYWNLHPQKTLKMRKCFWRWTFDHICMGLELSGCFCNFAYLKESVLGKCRCSSGQHAFKPHLQDLQWMQFRTTNLNIFARRHRQGHVCRKAYLSLPSQLLPSTLNTLPEQHNTHTHTHLYTG